MKEYELSNQGLAEIISYEAISTASYIDSGGVKTVGIGSTVSDIPDLPKWSWDSEITVQEAIDMFKQHVQKYVNAVNKSLNVDVTQEQFDALVSICYNIGTSGMAGSTFMKRVNSKSSPASIASAMKMWNKDNGKTVQGLTNRRAKEANLFVNGVYSSGMKAGLIEVNRITHKPRYGKTIDLRPYLDAPTIVVTVTKDIILPKDAVEVTVQRPSDNVGMINKPEFDEPVNSKDKPMTGVELLIKIFKYLFGRK